MKIDIDMLSRMYIIENYGFDPGHENGIGISPDEVNSLVQSIQEIENDHDLGPYDNEGALTPDDVRQAQLETGTESIMTWASNLFPLI